MNKLLNPSIFLPVTGFVMGIAFAAFGDTMAGITAFCFPIAALVFLRASER